MKYLDQVKVIVDKEEYKKEGIKKGAIGTIIEPEIRYNTFLVVFSDNTGYDYALTPIHVGDLELVKSSNISDEDILEDLPNPNPKWWCKVENGYIVNLEGTKKNKIAYDYDS